MWSFLGSGFVQICSNLLGHERLHYSRLDRFWLHCLQRSVNFTRTSREQQLQENTVLASGGLWETTYISHLSHLPHSSGKVSHLPHLLLLCLGSYRFAVICWTTNIFITLDLIDSGSTVCSEVSTLQELPGSRQLQEIQFLFVAVGGRRSTYPTCPICPTPLGKYTT